MNATIQLLIVAAIVAAASAYAIWKLMPAALRRALAPRAAAFVQRLGASDANARRVEAKLTTGGACGSCDSCKACATPDASASEGSMRVVPIRSAR